jgi:5-methylthioadenosine/S-adenosylhomocysteine deaminase
MAGAATEVDLLLRHGRVITMDSRRRILVDGALAIRAGGIVAAGPDRELSSRFTAKTVTDLAGRIVHPGFIDAHTHMGMDLVRAIAPKASRTWSMLESAVFSTQTEEQEYLGSLLSCMEMVANGTTTFADTGSCFFLDATAKAIETVGLRGLIGHLICDVPGDVEAMVSPTETCLARLDDQLARYPFHADAKVRCAVSVSGMGMCSDRMLVEARKRAERHRVPMIMHQSWGDNEVQASLARDGRRPVEHLADLGILGPGLALVHMIHLNPREVDLVARAGATVVHCPAAAIRRAMGAIRLGLFPEMLRAGIVVGLGSDGMSGKRDLARQVYLTASLFREVRDDLTAITGETALDMATINGARALGLESEIGSIEAGKRADLVIHACDRPEAYPRRKDPVDTLVFYTGSRTVQTVLVDGEVVFHNGQLTRLDADEALKRIDAGGARLEDYLGATTFSAWPVVE